MRLVADLSMTWCLHAICLTAVRAPHAESFEPVSGCSGTGRTRGTACRGGGHRAPVSIVLRPTEGFRRGVSAFVWIHGYHPVIGQRAWIARASPRRDGGAFLSSVLPFRASRKQKPPTDSQGLRSLGTRSSIGLCAGKGPPSRGHRSLLATSMKVALRGGRSLAPLVRPFLPFVVGLRIVAPCDRCRAVLDGSQHASTLSPIRDAAGPHGRMQMVFEIGRLDRAIARTGGAYNAASRSSRGRMMASNPPLLRSTGFFS